MYNILQKNDFVIFSANFGYIYLQIYTMLLLNLLVDMQLVYSDFDTRIIN